jgi:hypothetical protein
MLIYREIGRAPLLCRDHILVITGLINSSAMNLNRSVFNVHFLNVAAKVRLVITMNMSLDWTDSMSLFGTSRESFRRYSHDGNLACLERDRFLGTFYITLWSLIVRFN